MAFYIGIDLGTSAMKLLLMDAEGTIHNTVTKEYPLEFPFLWQQIKDFLGIFSGVDDAQNLFMVFQCFSQCLV